MIIAMLFALDCIFCTYASHAVCLLTHLLSVTYAQLVSIHPNIPRSKREFPTYRKCHVVRIWQEDRFLPSRVLWLQGRIDRAPLPEPLSSVLTVQMYLLNKMLICCRGNLKSWFLNCLIDYNCSLWVWHGLWLSNYDCLAIHSDGLKVTVWVKVLSSQLVSWFHKYNVAGVIYQKREPGDLDVWGDGC